MNIGEGKRGEEKRITGEVVVLVLSTAAIIVLGLMPSPLLTQIGTILP